MHNLGPAFFMPVGPMGALLGLQYGLTQAPAAQPRTIFVGQTISIGVALFFAEVESLDVWVRQCLALSVAIAAMCKLSVAHPPAAANAFIFADGNFGLSHFLVVLVG